MGAYEETAEPEPSDAYEGVGDDDASEQGGESEEPVRVACCWISKGWLLADVW